MSPPLHRPIPGRHPGIAATHIAGDVAGEVGRRGTEGVGTVATARGALGPQVDRAAVDDDVAVVVAVVAPTRERELCDAGPSVEGRDVSYMDEPMVRRPELAFSR